MSISAVCEICGETVEFEFVDLPYIHRQCFEECITKEMIEARIKYLEEDNNRLKSTNFSSFMNNNDVRISELKDLLK